MSTKNAKLQNVTWQVAMKLERMESSATPIENAYATIPWAVVAISDCPTYFLARSGISPLSPSLFLGRFPMWMFNPFHNLTPFRHICPIYLQCT